jgi:uncharacterized protein (TIGR02453 family)
MITRRTFTVLRALAADNTREWFQAHADEYRTDAEEPFLALLAALVPILERTCPQIQCTPKRSGGSMMRVHRDTRFSADKSPYRTSLGAMLLHRDQRRGPGMFGFVLHLSPTESYLGAGVASPDAASLLRIREAIVARSTAWARVRDGMQGATRVRVPAGFPADHQFAEDLRRVSYFRSIPFTQREVIGDGFPRVLTGAIRELTPLLAFLAPPLGLRW